MASRPAPVVRRAAAAVALAFAMSPLAHAIETNFSGRITFGSVLRTQESDPQLLTAINAAAIGLAGRGTGGNADDANLNYRLRDQASRALKAYLDLSLREGDTSALVRVKAWHDFGLLHDNRPWGNSANGYAANQPLSDAGASRLTRFSGVALGETWLQQVGQLGGMRALGRIGQQSLNWGVGSSQGGLEGLNPRDLPALHRAGAAPQETRVPLPMLFGRVEPRAGVAIEAYYQTAFRPHALDMCGTLWSMSDYMSEGCDRVMSGNPPTSDRARVASGAYQKRLPTPKPGAAEFGVGLNWKAASIATDFGFYYARYNSRMSLPGLRRSTRVGPALIPGDPDGKNMAYFTEYPEGLSITALTFMHKRGPTSVYGELAYRPRQPFMLAPGDVVPPFLSPAAPSLLRADVDATPPGGLFHGYDNYRFLHTHAGVQHEWRAGGVPLTASFEATAKHTFGLPSQAARRYNRADIYGAGPVFGVCPGTNPLQCSLRGYATVNAYGYRLRLDARFAEVLPGLNANASAAFVHDVKGWSGDFVLNEGRRSANLALRLEYRQRYFAEIAYLPLWGGDYNQAADRDTLGAALGLRF
ncbi:DUF1302 domain-containing protein [Massilia horti]|nr:DUF1302 family protein [Massilia horti]